MPYIGKEPADSFISFAKQDFTTSATTSYTLNNAVTNENELALFINFVRQEPTTAYTASGTTLTLTSATASTDDMYCVYLGQAKQTVNAPDGSVGSSQVASTIITGQTAETSIATDDTVLIHDTSAGALRKMTRANFVSGIGGTNTPAFYATMSGDQSITNNSFVKISFDTEQYDIGSCYDHSTNYRFTVPSGEAGKYFIGSQLRFESGANTNLHYCYSTLYKNGTAYTTTHENSNNNEDRSRSLLANGVFDLSVGDYFEAYGFISVNSAGSQNIDAAEQGFTSFFYGYKIIE